MYSYFVFSFQSGLNRNSIQYVLQNAYGCRNQGIQFYCNCFPCVIFIIYIKTSVTGETCVNNFVYIRKTSFFFLTSQQFLGFQSRAGYLWKNEDKKYCFLRSYIFYLFTSSSSFIYHKPPDITGQQGLKKHFQIFFFYTIKLQQKHMESTGEQANTQYCWLKCGVAAA